MKVIIQCAATKDERGGYWQTGNGKRVKFIAYQNQEHSKDFIYARPDDVSDEGLPWRSLLWQYNETPHRNPFNLYPAYKLYSNEIYRDLANEFGIENTYILSAGWGLIRADFLTPQYNITFSASAPDEYRRRKNDQYQDFRLLPDDGDALVFFGGNDYLPLLESLTRNFKGKRTVFYNSKSRLELPGCTLRRYRTSTRTNWHYECARALINGEIACKKDRDD